MVTVGALAEGEVVHLTCQLLEVCPEYRIFQRSSTACERYIQSVAFFLRASAAHVSLKYIRPTLTQQNV